MSICLEELSIVLYSVENCSCHADLKDATLFAETTGGNEQKINVSSEILEFVKSTPFCLYYHVKHKPGFTLSHKRSEER